MRAPPGSRMSPCRSRVFVVMVTSRRSPSACLAAGILRCSSSAGTGWPHAAGAGPGADARPFELWIYEGPIPPPPYADPAVMPRERRRRLLFLFVDQLSTGDYRLRYTTE